MSGAMDIDVFLQGGASNVQPARPRPEELPQPEACQHPARRIRILTLDLKRCEGQASCEGCGESIPLGPLTVSISPEKGATIEKRIEPPAPTQEEALEYLGHGGGCTCPACRFISSKEPSK